MGFSRERAKQILTRDLGEYSRDVTVVQLSHLPRSHSQYDLTHFFSRVKPRLTRRETSSRDNQSREVIHMTSKVTRPADPKRQKAICSIQLTTN